MTQTASRTSAKPAAAAAEPQVLEIEVGRAGKFALDKLANARIERLMAEKVERPLKDKVTALWSEAAKDLGKGDVLVVKAAGVVRGRVTVRPRQKSVDLDLLLQAFPEAFEACVSDTESPQFEPM